VLYTADGFALESRLDGEDADRIVVLCHPHPGMGGTMYAPLMNALSDRLVDRGLAVLRFNFRKESGEAHGETEVTDVQAAMSYSSEHYGEVCLAGWSFGGAMALRWRALSNKPVPVVAIAPAVSYACPPEEVPTGRYLFIIGARDQAVDPAEMRTYAEKIGAEVAELEESDHFFYFREDRVVELIDEFWRG